MVHNGIIKNSLIILMFFLLSCANEQRSVQEIKKTKDLISIIVPQFNADSAYHYIQTQVQFGPRAPNSIGHKKCADYLINSFKNFGADVILQEDLVKRYDGLNMNMKNIIASYNSDAYKRILLCAHWDTRFMADYDSINTNSPIIGANDGGSGVGVLLEIARQINLHPINIGVDIILFDVEDQGQPSGDVNTIADSWCLGSQYWSKDPHQKNYFANYGILLDMVGAKNAKFTKEGASVYYAEKVVDKVWTVASKNGFSDFFISQKTDPIIDDHLYINDLIHIPTINIVEHDAGSHNKFNKNHHKHSDNMNIIDTRTLYAVGQTVLEVLYLED